MCATGPDAFQLIEITNLVWKCITTSPASSGPSLHWTCLRLVLGHDLLLSACARHGRQCVHMARRRPTITMVSAMEDFHQINRHDVFRFVVFKCFQNGVSSSGRSVAALTPVSAVLVNAHVKSVLSYCYGLTIITVLRWLKAVH